MNGKGSLRQNAGGLEQVGRQGPTHNHFPPPPGFSWGELTPPRCLEPCPGQLQIPWGTVGLQPSCPAVGVVEYWALSLGPQRGGGGMAAQGM